MEIFKQLTANNITLEQFPFIKELAMEAYLIENESILQLDKFDFSDVSILDAEIALKAGRKSANHDGRIDILAKYGEDYLGIVELKLETLNTQHLKQLEDYLDASEQIISKNPDFWTPDNNDKAPKWLGVLVGTNADKELIELISKGYKYKELYPIAILTINRFKNQKSNEIFVITDTYFNYGYTSRDFSKFRYNNGDYNKGRLVNTIIKDYVNLNSPITYAQLENAFPKYIQGSLGVFTEKENAQNIYNRTGHRRHHIKPDEFIELSDCTVATCTQWSINNIKSFINRALEIMPKIKIEYK